MFGALGALGVLSLIIGLLSLILTSLPTSFSLKYIVVGIILILIYIAKEIFPETNFGRKKLMKLSFRTNNTEIGSNRRSLEEELKKFITDKGTLWYLYTDFQNDISTHCTVWIENDWDTPYDFIYKEHGYDDVKAISAQEIFEILADDLKCLYKPYIQKNLTGADYDGYLVYPDYEGGYHVTPGASHSSYNYVLKNIAIYSPVAWERRLKERAEKFSKSNTTDPRYKQT